MQMNSSTATHLPKCLNLLFQKMWPDMWTEPQRRNHIQQRLTVYIVVVTISSCGPRETLKTIPQQGAIRRNLPGARKTSRLVSSCTSNA